MWTYREVRNYLNSLKNDDPRLDQNVTVLLMDIDESFSVLDFVTDWNTEKEEKGVDQVQGVLDEGHLYFTVDA